MIKKNKLIILLAVTLVLAVSATVLVSRQDRQHQDTLSGGTYLENLAARVNDAKTLEILSEGKTFTLKQHDGIWALEEKGGYPADFAQVKQVLLALTQLKTVEPKTARPDNYARLGVEDPGAEVKNRKVVVLDASGSPISSVILGNSRGDGLYARKENDPQAWLVSGRVIMPTVLSGWLDRDITNIDAKRIKQVTLAHPDKSKVVIQKEKAEDANYVVANLPKGKTLQSEAVANPIAGVLAAFKLDDVLPVDALAINDKEAVNAEFVTFDGIRINVTSWKTDDKDYVRIHAELTDSSQANEQVRQEVESINKRTGSWVYQIPAFKASQLGKKLSDLVKA